MRRSAAPASPRRRAIPHGRFSYGNTEIAGDGRTLTNSGGFATTLRPDPLNPDREISLSRRHASRWLHFCGDKLLEISRRGDPWQDFWSMRKHKYSAGSRWNLYILNRDGQRERRLPERLHRGTGFEACDANTAVFHRYLRHNRARQFNISLAPATP